MMGCNLRPRRRYHRASSHNGGYGIIDELIPILMLQ